MPIMKSTVVLNAVSGMPEDAVVNTLYFRYEPFVPIPTTPEIDALRDRIADFYNVTQPIGSAVGAFIGEQISRTADDSRIDFYWTLDDGPPALWGSPLATRSWTLHAVTSGTPLPSECAVAASFHGDLTNVPQTAPNPDPPPAPATIRPAARRRGRIFLGPLQSVSGSEDGVTHEFLPTSTFRSAVAEASDALRAANDSTWVWVVASKMDETTYPVVGGYVDNAYDTQRRRGQAATARTLWP